jgi:hypothetical protein
VAIIAHASRRSVHMTTLFRPPKKLPQTSIRAPAPRASICGASSVTTVPARSGKAQQARASGPPQTMRRGYRPCRPGCRCRRDRHGHRRQEWAGPQWTCSETRSSPPRPRAQGGARAVFPPTKRPAPSPARRAASVSRRRYLSPVPGQGDCVFLRVDPRIRRMHSCRHCSLGF